MTAEEGVKALVTTVMVIGLTASITSKRLNTEWENDAVAHNKAYWDSKNKFHWIEKNCIDWFDVTK